MFTVIIPTYNCAGYIQGALDSLLDQYISQLHILVVDDKSTDHTEQVMQMYLDEPNVVYMKMPNRYGANVARNEGFKKACELWPGDQYVAFADADCQFKPNYLWALYTILSKNTNAPFAYCDFTKMYIDEPDEEMRTHVSGEFSLRRLCMYNYIDTSAALLRKSVVKEFDNELRRLQDWDFFLTVCKASERQPVYVDEILYTNIQRTESITNTEDLETAKQFIKKKHNI